MENIIKNLHKLKSLLSNEQIDSLEYSAMMQRRYARIFFKIQFLDVEEKTIRIQIHQKKSPYENYADDKRLMEIVEETFRTYFEDWKIQKVTFPYIEAPAEIVTPEWIKEQMNKYKIGSKKLVADFGIAKAEISAMINGHREMGIRTKGLFYYYFKYTEIQKGI